MEDVSSDADAARERETFLDCYSAVLERAVPAARRAPDGACIIMIYEMGPTLRVFDRAGRWLLRRMLPRRRGRWVGAYYEDTRETRTFTMPLGYLSELVRMMGNEAAGQFDELCAAAAPVRAVPYCAASLACLARNVLRGGPAPTGDVGLHLGAIGTAGPRLVTAA